MVKQILSIEEVSGIDGQDGYEVKTSEGSYFVLIDNHQSCCESWGYISSEDDFTDFIGTELLNVETVDKAYNPKKFEDEYFSEGEACFVNFSTSNGVLQLAVYNSHNGYYGHEILVKYVNGDKIEIIEDSYL